MNHNDDLNEREIRRRVEQRINERIEVYIHTAIYIAANLGLWIVWLLSKGFDGLPGFLPVLITLGWGAGLVGHAAKVYFTASMESVKDREVDEAIERERMRRAMYSGKRKNDDQPMMRLSEEGELVPADADEEEDFVPRTRAKRR